mgnify:CR=1 FL=1
MQSGTSQGVHALDWPRKTVWMPSAPSYRIFGGRSTRVDRLRALLFESEGEVCWPYQEDVPVGYADSALEKAMLERAAKMKGLE